MMLTVVNSTRATTLAAKVMVADDSASRRKGLLGRDALHPDEGLLIHPCEAVHTFGMRFPIDVLFLNARRQVVKARPGMGRRRIAVCLWAAMVLELPAGAIERTATQVGDHFEFIPHDPQ